MIETAEAIEYQNVHTTIASLYLIIETFRAVGRKIGHGRRRRHHEGIRSPPGRHSR